MYAGIPSSRRNILHFNDSFNLSLQVKEKLNNLKTFPQWTERSMQLMKALEVLLRLAGLLYHKTTHDGPKMSYFWFCYGIMLKVPSFYQSVGMGIRYISTYNSDSTPLLLYLTGVFVNLAFMLDTVAYCFIFLQSRKLIRIIEFINTTSQKRVSDDDEFIHSSTASKISEVKRLNFTDIIHVVLQIIIFTACNFWIIGAFIKFGGGGFVKLIGISMQEIMLFKACIFTISFHVFCRQLCNLLRLATEHFQNDFDPIHNKTSFMYNKIQTNTYTDNLESTLAQVRSRIAS